MNKLNRLNILKQKDNDTVDTVDIDEDVIKQKLYDWYMKKQPQDQEIINIDSVFGLSLEKIMFMKQYFKEQGFNPEDDDFEQQVLSHMDNNKNQITVYPVLPKDMTVTYTLSEGNTEYDIIY